MDEIDEDVFVIRRRTFYEHRPSTIPEDDTRRPVFLINDGRHGVRSERKDLLVGAGLYELNRRLQGIEKS